MVASASAIGSLFAIGGFNNEIVVVADEGHLVFYSSKTMAKIRSQRVSDSRIVGINAVTANNGGARDETQYFVHAVDVSGNYFIVDVSTNFIVGSYKMYISSTEARERKSSKPVIGARAAAKTTTADTVISAQWTVAPNTAPPAATDGGLARDSDLSLIPTDLRVVLLTPNGVYAQHAVNVANSANNNKPFLKSLNFPGPLADLTMSVGKENGVVVVGQRHRSWLWVSSAVEGIASQRGTPLRHLNLPARLMSSAVTPLAGSTSFVVGGDRGEIAYYPTANIETAASKELVAKNSNIPPPDMSATLRFFSDHWHSTPLQAVAFTQDGKSILSGAAERALVAWSVSGAFTRTRIMSSRREELTEGYLWKVATEAKIDKKARFRPKKAKRNGQSDGSAFITTDVASIVIPYAHSTAGVAAAAVTSPFATSALGCYVVGVSGQVAAMDLREQRVAALADGVRWSLSTETVAASAAPPPTMEAVEWMGRPALLVVSSADSEVRVVDPLTQQSLYTHHVRFNMETSLAAQSVGGALRPTAAPASEGDDAEADVLRSYFEHNKDELARCRARGTVGTLLATVAEGGRLIFTYEDLGHLGLDAVLRVWCYDAERQRHIEVQAIHSPHSTEVLSMRAVTINVPRPRGTEEVYEAITFLFTLDRLNFKAWRSVELPRHEARAGTTSGSGGGNQRNFLHLGGIGGSEKEADSFLWRVVGNNRCPSGRASCFALSEDGSVVVIGDEVARAYEIPLSALALAFDPRYPTRGFAVTDWAHLFSLHADATEVGNTLSSLRFVPNRGPFPSVFGRYSNGHACFWQADEEATYEVTWASDGIVGLIKAVTAADAATTLAVAVMGVGGGESTASPTVTLATVELFPPNANADAEGGGAKGHTKAIHDTKKAATQRSVANLPSPTGTVAYVMLPPFVGVGGRGGPSSSSSLTAASASAEGAEAAGGAAAVLDGRLMSIDATGVKFVPVGAVAANVKATEQYGSGLASTNTARLDLYFKTLPTSTADSSQTQSAEESSASAGGPSSTTTGTATAQQLVGRVLGGEAYAAPPMALVLSSLLSMGDTQ